MRTKFKRGDFVRLKEDYLDIDTGKSLHKGMFRFLKLGETYTVKAAIGGNIYYLEELNKDIPWDLSPLFELVTVTKVSVGIKRPYELIDDITLLNLRHRTSMGHTTSNSYYDRNGLLCIPDEVLMEDIWSKLNDEVMLREITPEYV